MKLKLSHHRSDDTQGAWHTLQDDVRFKIRHWTRTTQSLVDKRAKDKGFVDDLGIDWDRMPKGSGSKRSEIHTLVLADYLIEAMENVELPDGTTLTADDVPDIYTKALCFESIDLATWIVERAKEGGAKVVEEDAKN